MWTESWLTCVSVAGWVLFQRYSMRNKGMDCIWNLSYIFICCSLLMLDGLSVIIFIHLSVTIILGVVWRKCDECRVYSDWLMEMKIDDWLSNFNQLWYWSLCFQCVVIVKKHKSIQEYNKHLHFTQKFIDSTSISTQTSKYQRTWQGTIKRHSLGFHTLLTKPSSHIK